MLWPVPYKLSGNKVVKSDSGEVVKEHPDREAALKHLRALKANVSEGAPAPGVLGALLEGFDAARHPRDFHGRWRKGDKVHVVTSQGRTELGVVEKPAETHDTITSKGSERATTVAVKWADGDVTHERPGDIKAGHPLPTSRRATLGKAEGDAAARTRAEILTKSSGAAADLARHQSIAHGAKPATPDRHGGFKVGDRVKYETGSREAGGHGPVTFTKQPGVHEVVGLQRNGNLRVKHPDTGTTVDVHHSHAEKIGRLHPEYRGAMVQQDYARDREKIAREAAARAGRAFDPVTMLGREGTAARERGASSLTSEHADTRDKLTNLPQGRFYSLHGPQGQVGHVQRTAQGWEVYGPRDATPKVHKTPSSAAGHAMKIQRSAAQSPQAADRAKRGYAGEQEVRGMNARQSQRAEAEAERQRQITTRRRSAARDALGVPRAAAMPSHDRIVAELAKQGYKSGARVMANGSFPAEVVSVSDRGIEVKFEDGSGKVFIARGTPGFERTKVLGKRAQESVISPLDALLEGFAAPQADPFPDHPFTTGDQVRVSVGGGSRAVTGRVMRPHGGPPPTHAVIAPEGGGAHVLAKVGQVKLNTPAQHAAAAKRQERDEAKQEQTKAHAAWMAAKPPGSKPPGGLREGIGALVEAFAVAGGGSPRETPQQSAAIGARQVAQAQSSIRAGWNASKHPRGQGGKFGYTTGGKRAKRGKGSTSRTLGQGSSGSLVKSVQRVVGAHSDGVYGPQTRAAVERFQRQHGLQVDGVVGAQTIAALRGHVNPRSVRPGPIPSSAAKLKRHPAAKPKAPVRMAGGVVV